MIRRVAIQALKIPMRWFACYAVACFEERFTRWRTIVGVWEREESYAGTRSTRALRAKHFETGGCGLFRVRGVPTALSSGTWLPAIAGFSEGHYSARKSKSASRTLAHCYFPLSFTYTNGSGDLRLGDCAFLKMRAAKLLPTEATVSVPELGQPDFPDSRTKDS